MDAQPRSRIRYAPRAYNKRGGAACVALRWIGERVKRRAQALVVLAVYAAAIPLSIIPFALVVAFGLENARLVVNELEGAF